MKKLLFTLLTLLLFPALTFAQGDRISIAELRAQVQEMGRWTATYEAHGRTIEVDIPIIMPEASQFPVIEVSPWMPDISKRLNDGVILDDGWHGYAKKYADIGLKNLAASSDGASSAPALCVPDEDSPLTEQSIFVMYNDPDTLRNDAKGNRSAGCPKLTMYPWEYQNPESIYAENNRYSMNDALSSLETIINYYYESDLPNSITVNYAEILGRLREKQKDDALGDVLESYPSGTYRIHYFQNIRNIPLLLNSFYMYDYYALMNSKAEPDRFNSVSDFQNVAEIMVPYHSFQLYSCFLKEICAIEEDIPLAPIEAVTKSIEEQIENGQIRAIYSLRLGYVCFLNEGSPSRFTLYPMWVLECDCASSPSEEIRENPYSDEFREGFGFATLCFNAQSGEAVNRVKCTKESLECPDIIPWEDVQ